VKIEPPGGRLWERNWSGANLFLNGVSVFFLLAHRNQRSLTLDLKKPGGQAVARRLVERADVLVQNFRPGVMARFGLDWETARVLNPRLIYVSASGYGERSPYRDRPGQDLLMQAFSGLAHISGRADQPPPPGGPPWKGVCCARRWICRSRWRPTISTGRISRRRPRPWPAPSTRLPMASIRPATGISCCPCRPSRG